MSVEAEFRCNSIVDKLNSTGKVFVKDLALQLGVTEVTIRRDLAFLQRQGLLKKTYGGAVPAAPEVELPVRYRHTRRLTAKRTIGKLASRLIDDGDLIYLEAGSTCNEIIPYLSRKKNLAVIVNSLYLMCRLHELTSHRIIVAGGQYRPDRMDMVGPGAELAISNLGGYKAFTSADDITVDAGISGADIVTVGFTKLVLKKANSVIFVGDHTKFDRPSLYKIADIEQLDYIVTDTEPSRAWQRIAKKKNIKLIYPTAKSWMTV